MALTISVRVSAISIPLRLTGSWPHSSGAASRVGKSPSPAVEKVVEAVFVVATIGKNS
jgi:hypothetical protein